MRRITTFVLGVVLLLGATAAPAGAADTDHDGVTNARDRCPTIPAHRTDGCPLGQWRLRDQNSAGPAGYRFPFASLAGRPVAGDWNGDTWDEVGTFDQATRTWRLRETTCPCSHVQRFTWDVPAPGPHLPIVGDWDGDGDDTVGLYLPATRAFALRNTNSDGPVDIVFEFGGSQPVALVQPVAGDWDGDGDDTIGIFRADTGRWRLRNANAAGSADLLFVFGRPGSTERAISGDWDGNGTATPGLMEEEGIFYLRNAASSGAPDLTFAFGSGVRTPLSGDWDGSGTTTVGLRRS